MAHPALSDRNLLFGVLALQADFIERSQFLEACAVWAAAKDKGLPELLQDRGWIMPDDRAVVDQLLERRLAKHQGDVYASVHASADEHVRATLGQIFVDPSLAKQNQPFDGIDSVSPELRRQRYTLVGEPAKGGFGQVWRAKDKQLGREVALKELKEETAYHPLARKRFFDEAKITSQLGHPNIVPVYELIGPEASPSAFYTMKFVEGRTLTEAVREFHAQREAGHSGALEMRELVNAFLAVCHAVAHAHERGVLHRDLKGRNVILGRHGEVFLLDWGLAKLMHDQPGQDLPIDLSVATPEEETQPGQAMGTPEYMAPEQARGEIDRLGPPCDVFGLGGILCEILTGKPTFAAATRDEILRLAKAGEMSETFARLDGCSGDAELIRLAKHCLAPLAQDRPTNGAAVARAVAKYQAVLQERLKQAEIDRAQAEILAVEERKRREVEEQKAALEKAKAREERWRRRLTVGLAAAILALAVGVSGAVVWLVQDLAEKEHKLALTRQAVESSLEQLQTLHKRALWKEADALLVQAENQLGPEGDEELRAKVAQARRDTAFIKRLDDIRLEKSLIVERKLNTAGALPKYRDAFHENGFDILQGDPAELAAKLNESLVRDYLVAALDDWAMTEDDTGRKRIMSVTAKVTGQPWRSEVSAVWNDGTKLAELFDAIPLHQRTPAIIYAVGHTLEGLGKEGIRRIEDGLRQHPGDFWLHFALGELGGKERLDVQVGANRAALAIRPDTAAVYNNLGTVLFLKKEYDAAIAAYEEAIGLDSQIAAPQNGLGNVLWYKKEYDAAIAAYKKAIEVDPKFAPPHNGLGNVLLRHKKMYDAAIAAYKEAIRLDPKNALPLNGVGNVLFEKKEYDAAIAAYKEAIRLDPKGATPHIGLGNVLWDKKEYDAAIAAYKKAIRLDPMYAAPRHALGNVLQDKKEYDLAIAAYKEAIRLDPKDAAPHVGLGTALRAKKEYDAAIAAFREAIRLNPQLAAPHNSLGNVLSEKKEFDAATAAYKEAIRLDPQHAEAYNNLANTLLLKEDYDAAMVAYKESIRLDPKAANPHNGLGMLMRGKKEYAAAIAAFKEAIRLDPNLSFAHANLGLVYRLLGRFADSAQSLREAARVVSNDPVIQDELRISEKLLAQDVYLVAIRDGTLNAKTPADAIRLADFAMQDFKKEYALALRLFIDAFAADPKLIPMNRYNAACAAVQFAAGKDVRVQPAVEEWHYVQSEARQWLAADLESLRKQASADQAEKLLQTLSHWLQDPDLFSIRDLSWRNAMPDAERQAWQKLWADVNQLLKEARATFTESGLKGSLTAKERERVHELKMTAGKTYVIDMTSEQFDTYLRLEDAKKKVLDENDDIDEKNKILNSRIVFTPKEDGVYRIVAMSFEQRGVGAYTLVIREFQGKKK